MDFDPFLEVNFNFWRNKKQVRWPSRRDLYESGVFEGHTQLSVQKSFFTEKICDPHDGENCHKNNNAGSFGTYIKNKKVVSWSEKSESGVRSRTYYLQQEKTLQNRQITFPKKQTSNRHVSHETNFPAPVCSENTLKTVISKN